MKEYYAHSLDANLNLPWHLLKDHLQEVGVLAKSFNNNGSINSIAFMAGLLHDLGKYSDDFQSKLGDPDAHVESEKRNDRVDHSTAGAQFICEQTLKELGPKYDPLAKLIAYVIAGHHAGLADGSGDSKSCLSNRLKKDIPDYSSYLKDNLFENLNLKKNFENVMSFFKGIDSTQESVIFSLMFFTRWLFSCVVDADSLDTEKFYDEEKSLLRESIISLEDLSLKLDATLKSFQDTKNNNYINTIRNDILKHCLDAAGNKQGLYSLTVPTGGGKTIASMAFALKHALKHKQKKIIYVLPFTTIIEQNASVFKKIFGEENVLEHHSNYDLDESKENARNRLGSENWNQSIIVTTNVQFYESLFSSKKSTCRKIHNIAESVVILDEAQCMPIGLMQPCLRAINELALRYNTTVVLCTATQPEVKETNNARLLFKLKNVTEIIPDPQFYFKKLKRVTYTNMGEIEIDDLCTELSNKAQALCVVNTRREACEVYESITSSYKLHLSARMTPQHRKEKIAFIKEQLKNNKPIIVISTQLIEAGVDVDFPLVYRQLAGLDSIIQAGGRCNREGKKNVGEVYIFKLLGKKTPSAFATQANLTEEVLRNIDIELIETIGVQKYYQLLYQENDDSKNYINDMVRLSNWENTLLPFKTLGESFTFIDSKTKSLIINVNDQADELINVLRFSVKSHAKAMRKLQRHTIQIYLDEMALLIKANAVEIIKDQYYLLINNSLYQDDIGLCTENRESISTENLIF